MTRGQTDLAGVVVTEAAGPVQHQTRVLGAFTMFDADLVPAPAVGAVQLISGLQRACHAISIRAYLDVGGHVPYRVIQP